MRKSRSTVNCSTNKVKTDWRQTDTTDRTTFPDSAVSNQSYSITLRCLCRSVPRYTGWVKNVSCWFKANTSAGEMWTNVNSYGENEALSDIVTLNIYVTIVLCLNILYSRQTRASLSKHVVIKLCSLEHWTTLIGLRLPTFKSRTVHKIIVYLTLGLLSSVWNIYHSTAAYFFDPPCSLYDAVKTACGAVRIRRPIEEPSCACSDLHTTTWEMAQ